MSEDDPATTETAADPDGPSSEPSSPTREVTGRAPRRRRSFWRELPVLLIIAVLLALGIKAWLFQAFYIPSGSMSNTLDVGDRVLVNKVVYRFHQIHRGDVIVFNGLDTWDPETSADEPTNPLSRALHRIGSWAGVVPDEHDYVKRVIGVPGDTVACCTAGHVTVNHHPLDEKSYLYPGDAASQTPFGPVQVKDGQLWVMGDHRSKSADSRSHLGDPGGGAIPEDRVVGKAVLRIWPLSRFGTIGDPATFRQRGLALPGPAGGGPALLGAALLPVAVRRRRDRDGRRHR